MRIAAGESLALLFELARGMDSVSIWWVEEKACVTSTIVLSLPSQLGMGDNFGAWPAWEPSD